MEIASYILLWLVSSCTKKRGESDTLPEESPPLPNIPDIEK
jgi:hypothetical protein